MITNENTNIETDDMVDRLFTITQTANYLQVSDKTIRRLIKTNQLAASKVGNRFWRIRISDIEDYLQSHSNEKTGFTEK